MNTETESDKWFDEWHWGLSNFRGGVVLKTR